MGRERAGATLLFDSQGRLVAHDVSGLHIWASGAIPAHALPTQNKPLPRFRRMITLMTKTPDGRIMALTRSSSVFLWHADASGEIIPVFPPYSRAGSAPIASVGTHRGWASGVDGPFNSFRPVAISPRGDRIYLIEPSSRQSGFRAWSIHHSSGMAHAEARDLDWDVPLADGATNLALRRTEPC